MTDLKPKLPELQTALDQARMRLKEVCKRGVNFKDRVWLSEYREADALALGLERQIAALKDEEYAIPLEFPIRWDVGAPLPHLLINDHKALLLFYRRVPDPNWDGTTCRVVNPASPESAPLALVEFSRCTSAKLGSPNDEVLSGHPLEGKGLDAYTAQQVINSKWIREIQTINSVHPQYRAERWKDVKHYIFWFHDTTFECLAQSFAVEVYDKSMPELLVYACQRLNGH
jgi:hypothetical protein